MNFIIFVLVASSLSLVQAEEAGLDSHKRVKRTFQLKNKLCHKLGLCGGEYHGHGNGGHGYGGYQIYQGGYPYPPVNIAISQSQSSSNAGGGGFGTGYYPNNYQYNGGYPYHGGYPYRGGYGGYGSYGGNKQRPGYYNGYGSNNNQFNGNYYNGRDEYPQGHYERSGNEDDKPVYEESDENVPSNYEYGRDGSL